MIAAPGWRTSCTVITVWSSATSGRSHTGAGRDRRQGRGQRVRGRADEAVAGEAEWLDGGGRPLAAADQRHAVAPARLASRWARSWGRSRKRWAWAGSSDLMMTARPTGGPIHCSEPRELSSGSPSWPACCGGRTGYGKRSGSSSREGEGEQGLRHLGPGTVAPVDEASAYERDLVGVRVGEVTARKTRGGTLPPCRRRQADRRMTTHAIEGTPLGGSEHGSSRRASLRRHEADRAPNGERLPAVCDRERLGP